MFGQAANLVRTVNGTLVSLAQPQFQKYSSVISGTDQKSPALSGIWPGVQVTVDCIAELAVGAGTMDRPAVAGSVYEDGGVQYYRPRLIMLVTGYNLQQDEYGAAVSWSLSLEEM
jgi:hypothetical protein